MIDFLDDFEEDDLEDIGINDFPEEDDLHTDDVLLYNADPDCVHNIVPSYGGGEHCTKCKGWFCY